MQRIHSPWQIFSARPHSEVASILLPSCQGGIESKGENIKKDLVDVQLGLREKIIIFLSNLLFYLKSHPTIVLKF